MDPQSQGGVVLPRVAAGVRAGGGPGPGQSARNRRKVAVSGHTCGDDAERSDPAEHRDIGSGQTRGYHLAEVTRTTPPRVTRG
jgi:hypothetical protein